MKKLIISAFAAVLFFIVISGCIQTDRTTKIPNEAIDYCTEQGFDYELRGGEFQDKIVAYCIINESLECEVWDFYEGRCPTCEAWCESQPHIMCEGYWKISGGYPDCSCEYICYTEAL